MPRAQMRRRINPGAADGSHDMAQNPGNAGYEPPKLPEVDGLGLCGWMFPARQADGKPASPPPKREAMRLYPCENAKFRLASQVPTTHVPFRRTPGDQNPNPESSPPHAAVI